MIGRTALDGGGDDLPALFLCLVLQLLFDLLDLHGGFVTNIVFNAFQQILLGLLLGQPGELLQGFQLLLPDLFGLCLGLRHGGKASVQVFLFPFKGFGFLVQRGFFLLKPAFLFGQFGAAFFDFAIVFCAGFMDLVLGFQKHFLFPVFTVADGFVDQTGGLCLRRADLPFRNLFPVQHTTGKANGTHCKETQNDQKNRFPFHNSTTHLLPFNWRGGLRIVPM